MSPMVRIFSWGERWNVPTNEAKPSWLENSIFHRKNGRFDSYPLPGETLRAEKRSTTGILLTVNSSEPVNFINTGTITPGKNFMFGWSQDAGNNYKYP